MQLSGSCFECVGISVHDFISNLKPGLLTRDCRCGAEVCETFDQAWELIYHRSKEFELFRVERPRRPARKSWRQASRRALSGRTGRPTVCVCLHVIYKIGYPAQYPRRVGPRTDEPDGSAPSDMPYAWDIRWVRVIWKHQNSLRLLPTFHAKTLLKGGNITPIINRRRSHLVVSPKVSINDITHKPWLAEYIILTEYSV